MAILRPPPDYSFAAMRETVRDRLDRAPPFRWRLDSPPGGVGRPVWVEDPEFDLDRHLRQVQLEAPAGMRELCDLVARAAEPPLLDRRRPLWQMWVAEGLEDGRIAAVVRLHHAVADGVSTARLLARWFSDDEPPPLEPAGAPASRLGLALRTLIAGARSQPAELAAFGRAAVNARRRATEPDSPDDPQPAPPRGSPGTPFNGRLGPRRVFACAALSMEEVNSVRRPLGATVNDIVLALVAGTLRHYLSERAALPVKPLIAYVPVSRLAPDEQRPFGNRTSTCEPTSRIRSGG